MIVPAYDLLMTTLCNELVLKAAEYYLSMTAPGCELLMTALTYVRLIAGENKKSPAAKPGKYVNSEGALSYSLLL